MHGAHDAARSDLRDHEPQTVPRLSRSRRVVDGHQESGKHLHQKRKQRDASEYLVPTCRRGDVFIQEMLNPGYQTGAILDPIQNALQHLRLTCALLDLRSDQDLPALHLGDIAVQRP